MIPQDNFGPVPPHVSDQNTKRLLKFLMCEKKKSTNLIMLHKITEQWLGRGTWKRSI